MQVVQVGRRERVGRGRRRGRERRAAFAAKGEAGGAFKTTVAALHILLLIGKDE